jgi:hypothetical protein
VTKLMCCLLLLVSCTAAQRATSAATSPGVIECAKNYAPAGAEALARWGVEALLAGKVDWSRIEVDAKGLGLGVGSCAVAEFLRAYKANPKTAVASRALVATAESMDPIAQGEAVLARVSGGAKVVLP